MNIGVARPNPDQLAAVPHFFIASHSSLDSVNAATFEKLALEGLDDIFKESNVAVVVGGTGLYIKALCEGLDAIPEVPSQIRSEIINQYQQHGLPWLTEKIQLLDPAFFEAGEVQNPQRMMRALEVVMFTGQSILSFQKKQKLSRPFNIIKTALELPRPILQNRIDQRVDMMFEMGLLNEVESLLPHRQLNALQTVGYTECFEYFDGLSSLEATKERIKIHTRQYAKRQMTWFKKDELFQWFDPTKPDVANQIVNLIGN
jgi:tRNA dimethylallyltransferase